MQLWTAEMIQWIKKKYFTIYTKIFYKIFFENLHFRVTLSWILLGDPKVTANLYCHFAYPYWEGCVISVYICGNFWVTQYIQFGFLAKHLCEILTVQVSVCRNFISKGSNRQENLVKICADPRKMTRIRIRPIDSQKK